MLFGMDEKRLEQIRRHAEKRVSDKLQPGCSWCVTRHGHVVSKGVVGWSVYGEIPLTEDAIFRLASMSKPITACAVMMQAEKGLFRLTDCVEKYLPEFHGMQYYAEDGSVQPASAITIRQLLSHSSGLLQDESGMTQFAEIRPKDGDTLKTMMPRYAKTILAFAPETRSSYSGVAGLDVLSRLVEITSDMSYGEFLRKNIFEPLEMSDTTFHPTQEQRVRIVPLYTVENGTFTPKECAMPAMLAESYESGSANLVGTLMDYIQFAEMLRRNGIGVNGNRILCPRSVERMRMPAYAHTIPSLLGEGVEWGLGMRVITMANGDAAPLSKGAYGWSGAFNTHFFIDPTLDLTAVYMCNIANGGGAGAPTTFEFENDVMQAVMEY
uniref:Putative hydrolase n=1 Tax=uncultured bacterium fosmid pJB148G3 TaxID=1478052 RepID=A0A0H3U8E5_9BACT|nr:putative hydrolase [uncultured bacterium fosmid pJB148G3]